MAGITAIKRKDQRVAKAFGGVMGPDGRKAYVGGSYGGNTGGSTGRGPGEGTKGGSTGGTGGTGNGNRNGDGVGGKTPGPKEKQKGGTPDKKTKDEDRRQTGNVDKKNVKTGTKKTDTKTVTGEDTGEGSSYEKSKKNFKEAVDDYTKAQEISGYKPFKVDYLPVLGPIKKIFSTPFTIKGKTNLAKRRMEYINSLPPAQRKAMIDRLGYAVDEEYDELDDISLMTETYTNPKTGKVSDPVGIQYLDNFDIDPTKNYDFTPGSGTDYTLTDDPLSYVGENPIYGPDAMDIINYDGEY